ncbi:hypothetical protein [Mangrovibacterium lignilyticum]|uniref:hypothetical protein n=1 Tax=Mangrovibacterium lignilyticum TaxID=2668052 RepID=UPI0013D1516F|nr:hypothetical protein [Mangrovibacterium lignilyticum]
MKDKIKIYNEDFEEYLENALKSYGYIFPTTDKQMSCYEENMEEIPLPKEFESPDFAFVNKGKMKLEKKHIIKDNSEADRNWALAAREGKDIPEDVLEKMKKDKEEAKKKQDGNK